MTPYPVAYEIYYLLNQSDRNSLSWMRFFNCYISIDTEKSEIGDKKFISFFHFFLEMFNFCFKFGDLFFIFILLFNKLSL